MCFQKYMAHSTAMFRQSVSYAYTLFEPVTNMGVIGTRLLKLGISTQLNYFRVLNKSFVRMAISFG